MVFIVCLSACAAAIPVSPVGEDNVETATPAMTAVSTPVETPTSAPSPTPSPAPAATPTSANEPPVKAADPTAVAFPPGAEEAVDLSIGDLAHTEGVARETITVLSVDAKRWPDASLGCPKPDMVYAQVITPGFLVMLEVRGETYEYHTDAGRFVVLCQPDD